MARRILASGMAKNRLWVAVWMLLQEHGVAKYARLIEQNVEQATYLAGLVQRHSELELMAPVPLNVVCVRYVGKTGEGGKTGEALVSIRVHPCSGRRRRRCRIKVGTSRKKTQS